ncbi:MAG: U32 family peptidase [Deltaproteobacteria bacterium]|nr:U32 family peptidase [Deltaproteobacteria bacterium]
MKELTNPFELLLPVGQKEMALAAIHNGADAIYVGFPGFNARGRSYDFELEELKDIIETAHLFGVKVNLALNIVIFEEELEKVIEAVCQVLPLKPDAFIIQDLGLAQILRSLSPHQPLHASTQMTITNDLAIQLLEDLNFKRFVLGRENSLSEIKSIKERTHKELEVFVHGALCVSYSGQCFTSESLGGRSANRGQCAQSCRFSYELIVDGEKKTNLEKEFLVSPQDLCGIQEIPELMKIGVTSFKVEGRLKTPEYVASCAREFRKAMDQYLNGRSLNSEEIQIAKNNMAVQYSRGFFSGWLHGVQHQKLVDGTYSSHRGNLIGKVLQFEYDSQLKAPVLLVELEKDIHLTSGDGLLWILDVSSEKKEWGSFIFSVKKEKDNLYRIGISKDFTPGNGVEREFKNAKLYLNHQKEQKKDLLKSFQDKNFFKRIPIDISITLSLHKPLLAQISDGRFSLTKETLSNGVPAEKHPLTDEAIQNEFSSLGGSVFKLRKLNIHRTTNEDIFLNAKELKNLRQSLIQELSEKRKTHRIDFHSEKDFHFKSFSCKDLNPNFIDSTKLENISDLRQINFNVLLRNRQQVEDFILALDENKFQASDFNFILLDFEFGRDYRPSMESLRNKKIKVGIATTRILKPQEYTNLKTIASLNPDVILIRNLGALYYFQHSQPFQGELIGDFSLNVTNHFTVAYLLSKGLSRLCLSYDLNQLQVENILKKSPAEKLEITVHQYMPSFHMEHCVFAAFLSNGSSYKDCGKPCEKHLVQLKDQFNHLHWIKPDHECRNTMFHAKAQSAIKYVSSWRKLGLGNLRYEALNESGSELIFKLQNYLYFLHGLQTAEKTLLHLKTQESYGLSDGNLSQEHKYQSRKKDFSQEKIY